jgi:flagellar protein FlgJ
MIGNISSPAAAGATPSAGLRKQAQDLEGTFLNTLMSQMFSSIKTDGAFGGGFAEQTWRGMQSEQFASAMAQSGGIGLADQITTNLMQAQQSVQAKQNTVSTQAQENTPL